MFDLKTYLQDKRHDIDSRLSSLVPGRTGRRVIDAMRHSLMAGGKRLRPVLCIASMEALNACPGPGIDTACAIEMIHTYSLIHDDLPAMDNDSLRRGVPTCHMAFDEPTAILAGDALLTLAFEVMAKGLKGHPSALDIIEVIAAAAGQHGMVEGQMLDIVSEGKKITKEALEQLHRCKTGALIEASVLSGAMLAGGNKEAVASLGKYAGFIGLAFQVADDILNVEGDPALMGKAKGSDEELEKATFPSIIGLEESKAYASDLIDAALDALSGMGDSAEPLRAIARYIIERKR